MSVGAELNGLRDAAARLKAMAPQRITIKTALTPQITLESPDATLRLAIKDARLEPDPGHCRGCFEPVRQAGRVAEFCLTCAPWPGPGPVRRSWTAFKRAGWVTRDAFARAAKNAGSAFVMAIAHAMVGMDHALASERATDVRKRWKARQKKLKQNAAIAGAMGILENAGRRTQTTHPDKKVKERLDAVFAMTEAAMNKETDTLDRMFRHVNAMTEALQQLDVDPKSSA